jgi:hypothetical protein
MAGVQGTGKRQNKTDYSLTHLFLVVATGLSYPMSSILMVFIPGALLELLSLVGPACLNSWGAPFPASCSEILDPSYCPKRGP